MKKNYDEKKRKVRKKGRIKKEREREKYRCSLVLFAS
jgi:hypothetical protein